jgi:4-carboxymuconolactone decarboxylase
MPYETALRTFELVNTYPAAEPKNVYRRAAIELVFGQVWTRPGMTRRQRRWVSLTAAGMTATQVAMTAHVYGALNSGDISVEEMGEFLLHFCCYAGFPRATVVDAALETAVERLAAELGEPLARDFAALSGTPLEDLADHGAEVRGAVLGASGGRTPRDTPVSDVLVGGLEYGQVWSRPQLPREDRRLITITCLASQGYAAELRMHVAAGWESGDLGLATLREAALHAGLYCGVMTARAIDNALSEVAADR